MYIVVFICLFISGWCIYLTGKTRENKLKAKWLFEEALQTAEKRREMKSKEERKRYTQLNAEFQRTVRRNKKAFFN